MNECLPKVSCIVIYCIFTACQSCNLHLQMTLTCPSPGVSGTSLTYLPGGLGYWSSSPSRLPCVLGEVPPPSPSLSFLVCILRFPR